MSNVVHRIAHCYDCGKIWENQKTARQNGYNHAKKTGHMVLVETCTGYFYNKHD